MLTFCRICSLCSHCALSTEDSRTLSAVLASTSSPDALRDALLQAVVGLLQGGFEAPAFGDLYQRAEVRLDHAGEGLRPLPEEQRVFVALPVQDADRAERVAAGHFRGWPL